jgi:hypothetical protein
MPELTRQTRTVAVTRSLTRRAKARQVLELSRVCESATLISYPMRVEKSFMCTHMRGVRVSACAHARVRTCVRGRNLSRRVADSQNRPERMAAVWHGSARVALLLRAWPDIPSKNRVAHVSGGVPDPLNSTQGN